MTDEVRTETFSGLAAGTYQLTFSVPSGIYHRQVTLLHQGSLAIRLYRHETVTIQEVEMTQYIKLTDDWENPSTKERHAKGSLIWVPDSWLRNEQHCGLQGKYSAALSEEELADARSAHIKANREAGKSVPVTPAQKPKPQRPAAPEPVDPQSE